MVLVWVLIGLKSICLSSSAFAMQRDVKAVLQISALGAAAGTVIGLVSYPLTQDFKTTFAGSSVGLYLGIIIGIYHVTSRTDPQNPIVSQAHFKIEYFQWPEIGRVGDIVTAYYLEKSEQPIIQVPIYTF